MEQVKKLSFKRYTFEYLLLIFLILWSGGGFTYGIFPHWMLFALPIIVSYFIYKAYKWTKSDTIVLIFFTIVLLFQFLKFRGSSISVISPILTILICLMAAHILKNNFVEIYINIVYFFAVISIIFWLINIVPSGHYLLLNIANYLPQLGWENLGNLESNSIMGAKSLYLFTINQDVDFQRNSGPFWEPGRFTIFLIISLSINLFYNKKTILDKKNIILLLANITTFSTTGYAAMLVILLLHVFLSEKKYIYKVLLGILMLFIVVYVWNLDFMSDKINDQLAQSDVSYSRFGALFYHWTQIIHSPFIGYGPYLTQNFSDVETSPNGFTDLMRYFGIPSALLLFSLLYRGTKLYIGDRSKLLRIGVFLAIIILCFSQTITYSPFFYLLYFFGLNQSVYEKIK